MLVPAIINGGAVLIGPPQPGAAGQTLVSDGAGGTFWNDLLPGGTADHGQLGGLDDDDHPQYLTAPRGDVRYAPLSHGHLIADVSGLQSAIDTREPQQAPASEAEALTGTEAAIRSFSPLRIAQANAARLASFRATVNTWSRTQHFATVTLVDGASIAWDLDIAQSARVTLAGNRTLANPTNIRDGATYNLVVKQDATGGRGLIFSSAYKFPGGTPPVLSTAPNSVDAVSFIADGSTLIGVVQKDFK